MNPHPRILAVATLLLGILASSGFLSAAEKVEPPAFLTDAVGSPSTDAPLVKPWRVVHMAEKAEDARLVMTMCGGNALVMTDGAGQVVWQRTGNHYESLDVSEIRDGADRVYLYKNPTSPSTQAKAPLGTGLNFTLY